jgi:hypothetical protein
MKLVVIKFIEIFTDGTIHFSYAPLKSIKQVTFYEKDAKKFSFFRKPSKNSLLQNLPRTSYKSRYKF